MTVATGEAHGSARKVDTNALRLNQSMIVVLILFAFSLGAENGGQWLVFLTGLCIAIGAVWPGRGPFQLLYRRLLLPSGLVKARPEAGNPAPHRFAQSMGAVCLLISSVLLLAGFQVAGWGLAWIVVALALVNLIFGFCAGCFIFLNINRYLAQRS